MDTKRAVCHQLSVKFETFHYKYSKDLQSIYTTDKTWITCDFSVSPWSRYFFRTGTWTWTRDKGFTTIVFL